jgi:hypothetical protein
MRSLAARLTLGALGGFTATLPMTAVMRRMHERLPKAERYPLPPRQIVADMPALGLPAWVATLLHHFLFGAAAGSLFAGLSRRRDVLSGAAYGVTVWMTSYLGWLPARGILRPATHHPRHRNALMIAAHLVWGSSLAIALRELESAEAGGFSRSAGQKRELKDRA